MRSQDLVKLLIAFVAGIALAGGGAYMFSSRSQPATQEAKRDVAPAPTPVAIPAPAVTPQPEQPLPIEKVEKVEPEPKAPVVKPRPAPEKKVVKKTPVVKPETTPPVVPPPVDTASNVAPTQPGKQEGYKPFPADDAKPAAAPVRQPKTVTIPAGTALSVRLGEALSSEHNSAGDAFRATLDQPLEVDGAVIAEKGAQVTGKVVNSQRSGRVKGNAELTLALTQLHTSDGQTVDLDTSSYVNTASSSKKTDAAKIGGGAALGAIIGAIAGGGRGAAIGAGAGGAAGTGVVLGTRGKAATIPVETRMSFQLSNPVTITEKLN